MRSCVNLIETGGRRERATHEERREVGEEKVSA
jgi:hypothetical protein